MDTGRTCDCVWGVCHDDCGLFTTNCAVPLLVPIYCISSGILDNVILGRLGRACVMSGNLFPPQLSSERASGRSGGDLGIDILVTST